MLAGVALILRVFGYTFKAGYRTRFFFIEILFCTRQRSQDRQPLLRHRQTLRSSKRCFFSSLFGRAETTSRLGQNISETSHEGWCPPATGFSVAKRADTATPRSYTKGLWPHRLQQRFR